MSRHWGDIRRQARAWRAELLDHTGGEPSAEAILVAAAAATGLKSVGLVAGHPTLGDARAVLDVEASRVWFAKDAGDETGRVLRAHEYAHARLHASHLNRCTADDIQGEASEDGAPLGIGQVEGYGPDERREREANVYAQELLLPSDALRRWFVDEGLGATAIAAKVGLPVPVVAHHLAFALLVSDLLPDGPPPVGRASTAGARSATEPAGDTSADGAIGLDDSQREAAHVAAGPRSWSPARGPERRARSWRASSTC